MHARSKLRSRIMASAGAAAISALAAAAPGEAQADAERRPNILLIITDDIGLDVTTGMYPGLIDGLVVQYGPSGRNHPRYQEIDGRPAVTPVLDQFARDGMVFANAWAEPFCSPTRAALLTGLFSAKNHVLTFVDPLSQSHHSFVEDLSEAGYATGMFGKWHMAGVAGGPVDYPGMKPKEAGFDLFRGNLHAALVNYWSYDYQVQDQSDAPGSWRTEPTPQRSLPGVPPTTFAPVVKTADAIDWITAQEQADPDKPWLAWLALNLAHASGDGAPTEMPVPDAATLGEDARREMEACGGAFGSEERGSCSGEALMRASTSAADTMIGRLLATVDALDPNTYVIIVGDNGTPMLGRPDLRFIDNMYLTRIGRGKGTAYESGARVALAVRGPGIAAGGRSDEPVHVVDLFSTILELTGLDAPETVPDSTGEGVVAVDSVSLVPILLGATSSVRDPIEGYLLTESKNVGGAGSRQVGARNGAYKVVCSGDASLESCELYNLIDDPLEEYPLARPESCAGYRDAWTTSEPQWSFCRLTEVVAAQSYFREESAGDGGD